MVLRPSRNQCTCRVYDKFLKFKFHNTNFCKELELIFDIDCLKLDVQYIKFKGYTRLYWSPETPTKAEKINFEDALKRLEEISKKLEEGSATLDESLSLYNEGIDLLKKANALLDSAEKKIKLVNKDEE